MSASGASPGPPRPGRAAVLAVGDELVAGELQDANGPWLAARLAEVGQRVDELRCLPDDEAEIERAIRDAARERALVVVTGGLGPTLDDVTRHAAARAAGVELREDPGTLAELQSLWSTRGQPMPRANARQALFPRGATILPNPAGTAPGFRMPLGASWLAVLPGPPRELAAVFEASLADWLAGMPAHGAVVARGRMFLFGMSESAFADLVGERMRRDANPRIGVLASGGVLTVKLEAAGDDERAAAQLLAAHAAELRALFGAHLYSEERPDLAEVVGAALIACGRTLALAESCTGGMVAERLTRVPGISAVFDRGFVTYSDRAKRELLGVPEALLERHGAVSAEVAAAMARGAAERSGAELAVSITGVAGPDGGTPEKPVGLVHFGLSDAGAVSTLERRFPPRGRDLVRAFAANTALDLLRRALAAPG